MSSLERSSSRAKVADALIASLFVALGLLLYEVNLALCLVLLWLVIRQSPMRGQGALIWFVTFLSVAGYASIAVEADVSQSDFTVKPYRAFIFGILMGLMGLICHLLAKRGRGAGSAS